MYVLVFLVLALDVITYSSLCTVLACSYCLVVYALLLVL